jgi:chromosome segregation ATPase
MEELILKMAACLLAALALGFVLGWLIKRAFANEKFGTQIEELEMRLAKQKEQLAESQKESAHIKQQFLSNQEILDTTNLKMNTMQEDIVDYKEKITELKQMIKERELLLSKREKESEQIQQRFAEIAPQLEKKNQEIMSHQEELTRVKEHHNLLKDEVNNLKNEHELKSQEFANLNRQIEELKANEKILLEDQYAKEQKIQQLQSSINEKNIASIELNNKVKEIDALNQKSALLKDKLDKTELTLQDTKQQLQKIVQESEQYKQKIHTLKATLHEQSEAISKAEKEVIGRVHNNEAYDSKSTPETEVKDDGFDFMGFAKKTLKKITETSDEIIAKGDKAIQEHKNKDI